MRIGFDCAPLVIPHSPGIRRVVESSLRALEQRGNLEVVRLTPRAGENLRTWRRKGLARFAVDQKLQGLHAFQSAFCPGASVPSVQTVHELSWLHGVQEKGAWKQKLWVAWGRRRAAAVVCATQFSAQDYAHDSKRGPRPVVIPWGVDALFHDRVCAEDRAHLQTWGLDDVPFVLSPGGLRPKKRPEDLVRALAASQAQTPGHLVITGPMCHRWPHIQELAKGLQVQDRVHLWVDLPDHELAVLYRHARATAVISHSEGFALPVLESLVSGTVPLVTAQSAQSEVAGQFGLSIPAHDSSALSAAVTSVFGETPIPNPAAIEHARAFGWQRTAAGIEALWESLV